MKQIRLMLLVATALTGCETTQDVASTSFNVVTAPVRFVHRHIFGEEEEPPPPPPATSDVVTTPGQPVAVTSPTPPRRSVASTRTKSKTITTSKSGASSSSSRTASSGQTEFPTAKPVPGRPGLVFNPFDSNGGYIDVSGYAPGSKVKDPDAKNIFIVP
jgi:hypothetical protein